MRERAAALIKIGDGQSAYEVARSGLLKPRDVDTLYAWLDRFEEEGIDGLSIRPGRGRKPAFSPSDPVGSSRSIRDHARGRA
jgi:transposase